jgi:pilus assembly protein CpaB
MATGRLRGCLWLTAGLVVALLAGMVGYFTLSSASARRGGQGTAAPEVPVVVAVHPVTVRSILKNEDLQIRNVSANAAPEGSLRKLEDAVGKISEVDLYSGEVVLSQRLVDPNVVTRDSRQALIIANDQVLVALPTQDIMSQVGVLKPGDHIDLLYSAKFQSTRQLPTATGSGTNNAQIMAPSQTTQDQLVTFDSMQNVVISAIVAGKTPSAGATVPQAILVTLSPQDALVVKYIRDAGGIPDIVLRAPGADQPFVTEPVNSDYLINRYRIPTTVGK